MSHTEHFFIFAGEPSGDLHGSHLLKHLKALMPNRSFWGVGGPEMRKEGLSSLLEMEDFSVMGFSDVIRSLPKLIKQFALVKKTILQRGPEAVILIDYPGFNLRLAKHLRKKGYKGKIIQYISPTVWAHGKNRIQSMAKTLDLLVTIYPFESSLFEKTTLKVHYAGNPLQEYLSSYPYESNWRSEIKLPSHQEIIAIFPGSRQGEIQRNLPDLLKAVELFQKKYPESIAAICYSDEEIKETIQKSLSPTSTSTILVPKKFRYELMRSSRAALAKSGTVSLELALHQCPSIISYRLSAINWFFAKFILRLKLPYYCIVNILGEKEVYPEFIKEQPTPQLLAKKLEDLYANEERRKKCLLECLAIQEKLGTERASFQTAKAIEGLFYERK